MLAGKSDILILPSSVLPESGSRGRRARRFQGLQNLPRLKPLSLTLPRVVLDAERTTAAAAAAHIWIVEFKAGAVEPFNIVHFRSIHVQQARLIDKDLQPVEFKNTIVLIVEVLVKAHPVLESGTSAADNLDAQTGKRLRLIQEDLLYLVFGFFSQRNRH